MASRITEDKLASINAAKKKMRRPGE